jgi:ubiquinone/menaquinone biosynthesis C-methylase UbiE
VSTTSRRLVDYDEQNAAAYRRGRDLSPAQLQRWRAAVGRALPPDRVGDVVDAGSGAGLFLPLWSQLGADRIVAVEPSAAMRDLARQRAVERASVVAADLLSLPIATASTDVVWASAVLHHLEDRPAAFDEIRRVLRASGRLLVRGFLPDVSRVPWLEHFPGAATARARFPTLGDLAADAAGRLQVVDVAVVQDQEPARPAHVIEWVTAMRSADSILTALDDDDVATGLDVLAGLPDRPLEPVTLALVTMVPERQQ